MTADVIIAALAVTLPYADRLVDKITADRAAQRKHEKDMAAKGATG